MGSPELKKRFFTKLMSIYVGYVGLSQCSTEKKTTRSIFAKFATNIWTRNYVIKVALGLQHTMVKKASEAAGRSGGCEALGRAVV